MVHQHTGVHPSPLPRACRRKNNNWTNPGPIAAIDLKCFSLLTMVPLLSMSALLQNGHSQSSSPGAASRVFYQSFFTSMIQSQAKCTCLSSSMNLLLMVYLPRAIMPEGISSSGVCAHCCSFLGP